VIEKAVYDLTDVTWDYVKSFGYDGQEHTVALAGLPEGLVATYTNATAVNAGTYNATATVANENANYEDVELKKELTWTIDPVTLVLSWTTKDQADSNGLLYSLPVLSEGEAFVEYSYYQFDENSTDNARTQIDKSEIRVKETKGYYIVRVALKDEYAKNYTLSGEDFYMFSVDAGLTISGNVNIDPGQMGGSTNPNTDMDNTIIDGDDASIKDGGIQEEIINSDFIGDVGVALSGNESGGFPWSVVIVVAFVCLIASGVAFLVLAVTKKD
jgi:hypothetical protein